MRAKPICLTIAGSDPGGGAGIQADLKTMASLGVYGCSVITALTAQNTVSVKEIFPVSPGFFKTQLSHLLEDIFPQSVKIGMLFNQSIMEALWELKDLFQGLPIVLDPVITATSGDLLMEKGALDFLRKRLFPLCEILTPNIPEAEILAEIPVKTPRDVEEAGRRLLAQGVKNVLIKGGHGLDCRDTLFTATGEIHVFERPRIHTPHTHGTGCTLSAAMASFLALGHPLRESVSLAKEYTWQAIRSGASYRIGRGRGPLDHNWKQNSQTHSSSISD